MFVVALTALATSVAVWLAVESRAARGAAGARHLGWLAVAWLADGSQVVVAGDDGRIRLIDPNTVEISEEISAVDGWAYSLAVHPTDGSLLVGGRFGQLKRVVPVKP